MAQKSTSLNSSAANPTTLKFIDFVIRFALLFIFAVIPFVYSQYTKQNFLGAKEFLFRIIIIPTVAIYLLRIGLSGNKTEKIHIPLKFEPLMFLVFAFTAAIFSMRQGWSLFWFLSLTSYYWFALIAANYLADTVENVKLTITVISIAASLTAFYGVLQYFGIDPIFGAQNVIGAIGKKRVFSFFGNPNFLTEYLVPSMWLAAGIAVAYIKSPQKRKWGFVFAGLFLIIATCVWVSVTRAAMLGMIMGGLFFLLMSREIIFDKRWRKLVVWIIIAILLIFIILFFVSKKMGLSLSKFYYTSTIWQRFLMWWSSLRLVSEQPGTGTGLWTYRIFYPEYQFRTVNQTLENHDKWLRHALNFARSHNEYINVTTDLGIFALFFFLLFFFRAFARGINTMKQTDWESKYIVVGALSSIVGFMTVAFFGFPFQRLMPKLTVIFSLLIALNSYNLFVKREQKKFEIPEFASWLFMPVGSLLVLGMLYLPIRHITADVSLKQTVSIISQFGVSNKRALQAAAQAIQFSNSRFPYNPETKFHVANLLLATGKVKEADKAVDEALYYGMSTFTCSLASQIKKLNRKIAEALYLAKRSIGVASQNKNAFIAAAELFLTSGFPAIAVEIADEGIKHGARRDQLSLLKAEAYWRMKMIASAEHELDSIPNSALNLTALQAKARVKMFLKKFDEAKELFEKIVEISPRDKLALENLLFIAKQYNNWQEANKWATRLLAISPNDTRYMFDFALSSYQLAKQTGDIRKLDNAISFAQSVFSKIKAKDVAALLRDSYLLKAQLLYKINPTSKDILFNLQKAVNLGINNPQTLKECAHLYAKLHQFLPAGVVMLRAFAFESSTKEAESALKDAQDYILKVGVNSVFSQINPKRAQLLYSKLAKFSSMLDKRIINYILDKASFILSTVEIKKLKSNLNLNIHTGTTESSSK